MACTNQCNQGRDECPTPMLCGPQDYHLAPYIMGSLAFCLIVVIGLVLLILSLR